MNASRRRFLLISRIGPDSLHPNWLAPAAARDFDVLLSAYDARSSDPNVPGVFFEHRAGRKVAGYAAVFAAHADVIAQYDYVGVFDDDLLIGADQLTRLFTLVAAHDLKIAQPALTHDSHFTYASLLRDAAFRLRYVNYIEMMCPIFRQDSFQAVKSLYDMGYESGIDLIWCNMVATTPTDFAVIDDVVVRHTRPVGVSKAANGFVGGKRYEDDIHAILSRFDLPWLSCVPFEGIDTRGRPVRARWRFFLSSLALVTAIGKGPGIKLRARNVAVYWKHLLTRRALNLPIAAPEPRLTSQRIETAI